MNHDEIKSRIQRTIETLQSIQNNIDTMQEYDIPCALGAVRSSLNILVEKLESESKTHKEQDEDWFNEHAPYVLDGQ